MNRRDTRAFGTNGLPDPHLNVGGGVMIDGVLYSRERYEAMLRGQATPRPMPDTSDYDKPRIVATLNRKYGTTLTVEILEVAVTAGFSSWESLWLDSATTLAAEANDEGPMF